ncbi:Hint domain-containing protein [Yoonia sp.]|uniref:Hint domain-containing protein n=1 Tax=Yoonia sp. TaxID=2212373 RepID=UPI00391C75E1
MQSPHMSASQTPPDHDRAGTRPCDLLDLTAPNLRHVIHDSADPEASVVTYLSGDMRSFGQIEQVIPCFTPGTLIATPLGERPAETLAIGDRVQTRDNGVQTIIWAGQKTMKTGDLCVTPAMRPVMIRKGALGDNLPERDMVVSPNHRMLVVSDAARQVFGDTEVLLPAKHMTAMAGIEVIDMAEVTFLHFMFANHEIVLSDGIWSESFQPSDLSLQGIDAGQRDELLLLFPELSTSAGTARYSAARRTLQKSESLLIAA